MEVSSQERIIAGTVPLVSLIIFYTYFWLYVPLVILFLLLARRFDFTHSKMTLLKVMDLWLSTFIYVMLLAALAVGIRIAVRDAGTNIPYLSDDGLKNILMLVGMGLSILATVSLSVAGFRGRNLKIPGLIRPFEYWSGRRGAPAN
ncbi:hypothetical protein [Marinobacter sp. SS13-12]|uniref:hypothetical protein n=1 Tax=Marinobacter sp. SS13-12 TaxID=3050451 RepID=UPI0025577641|nr:hypothetical protein [Marinobacter sp. SS13-12]MDK8465256.1 hypothetical protein [Marinobacter sp. SS13-12]